MYRMVYEQAGQRPGDALELAEQNAQDGHLVVKQSKTKTPLRIAIIGEFKALLDRIKARRARRQLDLPAGQQSWPEAESASAALALSRRPRKLRRRITPDHPERLANFWLYDLRAKGRGRHQ